MQSQSQFVRAPEVVVFTGDLVASSKLRPEEIAEAMRALEAAAAEVVAVWGAGEARDRSLVTRYRGDGWQCLGPAPEHGLRGSLVMRARLAALGRAFDTRISIGIGAGVLDQAAPSVDAATGPAFELSGRELDRMGHSRRFGVAWERPPPAAALIRTIFALADEISRNWTPAQARVFAEALAARRRPSQEALADALGVTQQVVARHFASGGEWALREALEAFEGQP